MPRKENLVAYVHICLCVILCSLIMGDEATCVKFEFYNTKDHIHIAALVMLHVFFSLSSARVDRLEDDLFSFTGALVQVASFFCQQDGSESDSPKFCEMTDLSPLTVICLSVLIHHLKQFGLERALRSDA